MLSDLRSSPLPLEILDPVDSPAFTVTIVGDGDNCIAHVFGELDIATRNILFHACLGHGHGSVVVDLAAVEFMDCGGYGGIVAASLVLQERGGSLTLRNQTGQPAHLLDLLSHADLPAPGPARVDGYDLSSQSESRAQTHYRYILDDSGVTAVNGSAATNGKHRERVQKWEPISPNGASRQVCIVRHPVDRR